MRYFIYLLSECTGFEYRRELTGGCFCDRFIADGAEIFVCSTMSDDSIQVTWRVENGELQEAVTGVECCIAGWSKSNYLLLPAAVYNANRGEIRTTEYPPKNPDGLIEINPPLHTANIPHFEQNGGGVIEQTSGDVSFPGVGFYSPAAGESFWFLTACRNEVGNYGYILHENTESGELHLKITSPVYRRFRQISCRAVPAEDRGAHLCAGDTVTVEVFLSCKKADSVSALFAHLAEVRNLVEPRGDIPAIYPMSQADRLIKQKFCKANWDHASGYFMTATDINSPCYCMHWQLGWIGGGISSLPMIMDTESEVREKARTALKILFEQAQNISGLYYGCARHGRYYADAFHEPLGDNRTLLRKNADALFFLIKHFMLMEDAGEIVSAAWKVSLLRQALAISGIWQKNHQFGQWVNSETCTLITGGSSSAVMAIGGLVLAAEYFGVKDLLKTAEEAAVYYATEFLEKGIMNGCPGEIMQACDSEAGYAMLESMMTLWEVTGKACYLDWAEKAALYCMSWCVSYNYAFPEGSPFGKLDMKSTGTVWANVQNKHSAPGFCTSSGSALLRLFRATGKRIYMDLLRDIVRALPQFVSRRERPIADLEPGWINERVNLSDWEGHEMVGNVFYGSCWPEVSLMLSYLELPGVYVREDTEDFWCLDHVEAFWDKHDLVIVNPTEYPARIKVFSEDDRDAEARWRGASVFRIFEIMPGEQCRI